MLTKSSSSLFGSAFDLAALIAFKVATIALAIFAFKYARATGGQFVNASVTLLTMSPQVLIFIWPIVLITGAIFLASLGNAPKRFQARFLLVFLPLYCSIFTAMWGALKWRDMQSHILAPVPQYDMDMLTHIFHVNIAISIALLLLFKGHRFFFLGLIGLMQCYYFGVVFCATMAVSGVWL